MNALVAGFVMMADPLLVITVAAAVLFGVLIGTLPGLNATTGAALLLPLTLTLPPLPGIAALAALYCAATFSGSITAILLNIPGTSASATTCLDGYALASRGQAHRALSMAIIASTIGGTISVLCLMLASPLLARIASSFSAPDYLAVTLFGLTMLAGLSGGSALRNLLVGAFGLLIASVGIDPFSDTPRYTFGFAGVEKGVSFIALMIGLFGLSELLIQSLSPQTKMTPISLRGTLLPSRAEILGSRRTILRSSGIGTLIGILPAEGATVAAVVGYNSARRLSKEPSTFGKGSLEGIAASEAANNAATGGAMVPTLALGIPGSPTAAVILSGLLLHGLQPGADLFARQDGFVFAIFWSMLLANLIFMGLGLLAAGTFAHLTRVPKSSLWPCVLILSLMGTYALNQSLFDVLCAVGAGMVGFVMRRRGYSVVPLAIGLILGSLLEVRLGETLLILDGVPAAMLNHPVALAIMALSVIALVRGLLRSRISPY